MDIVQNPMQTPQKSNVPLIIAAIVVIAFLGLLWRRSSVSSPSTTPKPATQTGADTQLDGSNPDVWADPDGKGPDPYEANSNTRITRRAPYTNSAIGFTLTFPAGWYLPPVTDNDPHFYSCASFECDMALEVQSSPEAAAQGFDATWKYAFDSGLKPRRADYLVPGARVIASSPEGGAEGWQNQYWIFNSKDGRAFIVFTNGTRTERNILSTFRIIK